MNTASIYDATVCERTYVCNTYALYLFMNLLSVIHSIYRMYTVRPIETSLGYVCLYVGAYMALCNIGYYVVAKCSIDNV